MIFTAEKLWDMYQDYLENFWAMQDRGEISYDEEPETFKEFVDGCDIT